MIIFAVVDELKKIKYMNINEIYERMRWNELYWVF